MTSHSYPADCLKTNLRKFAALWAKKGQKAGVFLHPMSSKMKPAKEIKRGEKERARRKKGREERIKATVVLLVFIMATFDGRVLFGDNVFKNLA